MAPPLRAWTGGLAVVLGVFASMAVRAGGLDDQPCAPPPRPDRLLDATVRRVIDGDTVVVRRANGRPGKSPTRRGRYPGGPREQLTREIARTGRDAATVQKLGRRAATFRPPSFRSHAASGSGWTSSHATGGALLAAVWRDDGVLVNLALLEAGPPECSPCFRTSLRRPFRVCAGLAWGARRGLWATADARESVRLAKAGSDAPGDRERRPRGVGFLLRRRSRSGGCSSPRALLSTVPYLRRIPWSAARGQAPARRPEAGSPEAAEFTAALASFAAYLVVVPVALVADLGRAATCGLGAGDAAATAPRRLAPPPGCWRWRSSDRPPRGRCGQWGAPA